MNTIQIKALKSWRNLNDSLPQLSEAELKEMLTWEIKTGKRKTIAERIHQRYGALRMIRERDDIMEKF